VDRVLAALSVSEGSIQVCSEWLRAQGGRADAVAALLADHAARAPRFDARLAVAYVMYDVLHRHDVERKAGRAAPHAAQLAEALERRVAPVLRSAAAAASTASDAARLSTMVERCTQLLPRRAHLLEGLGGAVLRPSQGARARPFPAAHNLLAAQAAPGALPSPLGAMPPGAMPPGAMPPGAMPRGAMPPGAMVAHRPSVRPPAAHGWGAAPPPYRY
jgi:hypothetical protein